MPDEAGVKSGTFQILLSGLEFMLKLMRAQLTLVNDSHLFLNILLQSEPSLSNNN
jgi:uncharacterized SAM-binding protein YcdF (DUF218 family)